MIKKDIPQFTGTSYTLAEPKKYLCKKHGIQYKYFEILKPEPQQGVYCMGCQLLKTLEGLPRLEEINEEK